MDNSFWNSFPGEVGEGLNQLSVPKEDICSARVVADLNAGIVPRESHTVGSVYLLTLVACSSERRPLKEG